MVSLIFYGGAGEIGGNKILLKDKDTRIFLDFGLSFGDRGRFFSDPFLTPRDERDLIELGVVPPIRGLYRSDGDREAPVDAVVVSHAHTDHYMHISLLNRKIPVYCGETARTLIQAYFSTRQRSFEADIEGLEFKTFRTGARMKIGGVTIEPIHVDHSVPGAYGMIIETSEGTIGYSGDLRLHGAKSDLTMDYVKRMEKDDVRLLLMEGTNIVGADPSSESEVAVKAKKIVSGTKRLVLAGFSTSDMDRFRTFYRIAKEAGRRFVLSPRQALVLDSLRGDPHIALPDPRKDEDLAVYMKRKKTLYEWEKGIVDGMRVLPAEEIRRNQEKMLLFAGQHDMREMLDIRPDPGSLYIHSSSEPFNEETTLGYERFVNWLDFLGLPMFQIHCSGHIYPDGLREILERSNPKALVPIHTDHSELYAKWAKHLVRDVRRVEKGGSITL